MIAETVESEKRQRPLPLAGLRVLDLTTFLSGPYATQVFGDLGADVIKVETLDGDMTRHLPPYFVGDDSAYYLSVNRNKHSIALDLKTDDGKNLLRSLALQSDIVVENFRPGVLARLGLSYNDIAKEKPAMIWCSISGFGQNGPYRDRPAYDMIVQAMSGGMSMTGEPQGRPVRSGIPLGDISAGLYAVIGTLAALDDSRRSGRGRQVDVAMLDCQIAMLSYQAAYYLASGNVPERQGSGHDSIPTYRSFTCGDGVDLVTTANTERMWQALCTVLGRPDLVSDERFRTVVERHHHRRALWEIIEPIFRTRDAAVWVRDMVAAEIPAAVVNTLDRSLKDPQVLHRNMVATMENAVGEKLRVAGNPIKFAGEIESQPSYPPALAADGDHILRSVLGLSRERIEALQQQGVIGPRRKPAVAEV
ncbi:MAG TPA: CoA transferase [Beijerinckiaceae bacterium]|jgi:crotonobetainyl-CoA:carnitine CoA-transferase CaiB-like acyl-CoA transferase|nr:CoA transferase [Beijerinckiaceae bacterium]